MYTFLDDDKLIYNRLFGFRTNYSMEHALISLIENVKYLLDSGYVVYVDMWICGMWCVYCSRVSI